jgi:hypothetical protein
MSRPSAKITRTIRSEQVLNAFVEVVRKNLPLDLKNTRITLDDIIYALAYANVHRLSIESACQELQDAPWSYCTSSNTGRRWQILCAG